MFSKECGCGMVITGKDEKTCEANFKRHQESAGHKRQIKLKGDAGTSPRAIQGKPVLKKL